MAAKKYAHCLLSGEIKNVGNVQVFEFHGKDARGFDFGVEFAPIEPDSYSRTIARTVDADRVVNYLGGEPAKIGELGAEIEIAIGEKPEVYKTEKATIVYVPKGQAYKDTVLSKPQKVSWRYTITLPPKYVEPSSPAK